MMTTIHVKGISCYAHHGCLEEEGRIGSDYIVDVVLGFDILKSADTDRLTDTADYVVVGRIVKEEMAKRSKLIESVLMRIVHRLHDEITGLNGMRVEVRKLNPPVGTTVEEVSVVFDSLHA